MSSFQTHTRETEDGIVVALSGEVDLAATATLEAELHRVERLLPDRVVIDLREVSFIDSSGLRLLLAADARARKAGSRLEFLRGPDAVQRVFEIALLDRRLAFVDAANST